jgi:tyrosyl-tRNA synthetase
MSNLQHPILAADVTRAQTRTHLLFESDISGLKAEQITSAFEGDPRLVMIDEAELFGLASVKLAAKYGLASSASEYFSTCS